MDAAITLALLTFVAAVCVCGIFAAAYRDGLLQRVGMSAVLLWAVSQASCIWEHGRVDGDVLVLSIGLAAFAGGTLRKVVFFARRG